MIHWAPDCESRNPLSAATASKYKYPVAEVIKSDKVILQTLRRPEECAFLSAAY